MSAGLYALVAGSSSGLGLTISRYLLAEGFVVFGASRSGTDINHSHFFDIQTDLRNELAVEEMFKLIAEKTGALHLVVNSAGVCQMAPLEETASTEFLDHLKTNVLGAFHLLKHVGDFLIENTSHVIHISSLGAQKAYPQLSAYCASLFALEGLIQSVKIEWAGQGIKFTTMHSGIIDTPLWDKTGLDLPRNTMMSIDDFMYMFDAVVKAPAHVVFDSFSFAHREE